MAAPGKLEALVRWLNLVPYFTNHAESSLMEAADNLGVDARELKQLMQTLTCVGVGQYHGELFDMEVDYKGVHIIDDLGLNQPLRLTPTEASTFLLTLEALEEMPGLVDAEAVKSAAAKLRASMDEKASAIYDSLAITDPEEIQYRGQLADAIARRVQVRLTYWSASRDATSTRVVDPVSIFLNEDDAYLRAWQEDLGERRTFRIDRIQSLEVLDTPVNPAVTPEEFDAADPFGLRSDSGSDAIAELAIHPEFTWLAEYHDIALGETLENGWVAATMPIGTVEWFTRFALGQADRILVKGPENVANAISVAASAARDLYTQ